MKAKCHAKEVKEQERKIPNQKSFFSLVRFSMYLLHPEETSTLIVCCLRRQSPRL